MHIHSIENYGRISSYPFLPPAHESGNGFTYAYLYSTLIENVLDTSEGVHLNWLSLLSRRVNFYQGMLHFSGNSPPVMR